jgi:hypothetical protein
MRNYGHTLPNLEITGSYGDKVTVTVYLTPK